MSKHLTHITIRKHPILKDIDIPLINPKTKKPYEIIAFVGENGCGKTTILNELFDYDKSQYICNKENSSEHHVTLYLRQGSLYLNAKKDVRKPIDGKDTYPTISFNDETKSEQTIKSEKTIQLLSELGDQQILKLLNENDLLKFSFAEEVTKLIDGKEHGHDIACFSSGQQEILAKLMDLQKSSFCDSILLDEPESSLHPRWQRKIIDIIQAIVFENNQQKPQIFLATHSEKVLESLIEKQNALIVRLYKEDGLIKYETITQMSLALSNITFSELDYIIFKIPTFEYHSSLFNEFLSLFLKDNNMAADERISLLCNEIYKEKSKEYEKPRSIIINRKPYETKMLPTYVRDYFHHPNKIDPPTKHELVKSIELMRTLINHVRKKNTKK